ncbi:MAG: ATP phosphoribosyltransferase regulatory subunit [Acidobacteriota bacterium]
MKVSAALPPGVSALFFSAARQRRRLEAELTAGLESAGYSEVIVPILDYFEPYEALLSQEGRQELYRFIDRDGQQVALRGDFTPMLARLLAPQLPSLELPLRLFYRGDVVRYAEDRPGRQRESYQLGAELLGVADGEGEEEILRRCLDLLVAARVPGARVVLGVAGALDTLLEQAAPEVPERDELAAAVARRERDVARRAAPQLFEVVRDGKPADPEILGLRVAAEVERLEALCRSIDREYPSIDVAIDLAEFARLSLAPDLAEAMRRRSYYDGLLFRAYSDSGALPLGSGGRYDRLFSSLGAELPAVGFSLSLDRVEAAAAQGGEG